MLIPITFLLSFVLATRYATSECWGSGEFAQCSRIGCDHSSGSLGFESYPLTTEMLTRSVPYEGDTQRLHDIIRRSIAGEPLHVVVIGGSVTFGHACKQGLSTSKECAWPARIETWLQKRFPHSRITVDNRAERACASTCQIGILPHTLPTNEAVDIVIVDLGINDAELSIQQKPLKSGSETFRSFEASGFPAGAVEAILRRAVGLQSKPAVIYMQTFEVINGGVDRGFYNVDDWYRPIVRPYGAHTLSYRDAVWPVFKNRTADVGKIFWAHGTEPGDGDGKHPGWRSHQLYADMLAHFLDNAYVAVCEKGHGHSAPTITAQEMFRSAADPPLQPGTTYFEDIVLCSGLEPSTLYEAGGQSTHGAVSIRSYLPQRPSLVHANSSGEGVWRLFEDVTGKPGLIAYGLTSPHGVAEFTFKCRIPNLPEKPWLAITYLRGYAGMGAVRIFGTNQNNDTLPLESDLFIDALYTPWKASVSVTKYVEIDETFYDRGSLVMQDNASFANITASFQVLGPEDVANIMEIVKEGVDAWNLTTRAEWKFKIVRLSCC